MQLEQAYFIFAASANYYYTLPLYNSKTREIAH